MTDFWGVDLRKYMLSSYPAARWRQPGNEEAAREGGLEDGARSPARVGLALRSLDVVDRDLAGAAVLGGVEGHLLAFNEAADAGALERRRMDEHVLAAVVGLDEAEAFLIVVEFHGARGHGSSFAWKCT